MMRFLMICMCVCGVAASVAAADAGRPKVWLDKAAATQWLARFRGGVSFFSQSGVIPGSDADVFIALKPGGVLVITETENPSAGYQGTYEMGDTGEITLRLEGKGPVRSVWQLYQTESTVGLMRKDGKTGEKGDVTRYFGGKPFWSLKRMKKEDARR